MSIDVGVASNISFTAPSDLKVGINRTQTINALDYASDSGYTITCGTATSVDSTKLTSVARDSSGNGCGYTITPISTLTQSQQGAASFTVPLTSDGGDSRERGVLHCGGACFYYHIHSPCRRQCAFGGEEPHAGCGCVWLMLLRPTRLTMRFLAEMPPALTLWSCSR